MKSKFASTQSEVKKGAESLRLGTLSGQFLDANLQRSTPTILSQEGPVNLRSGGTICGDCRREVHATYPTRFPARAICATCFLSPRTPRGGSLTNTETTISTAPAAVPTGKTIRLRRCQNCDRCFGPSKMSSDGRICLFCDGLNGGVSKSKMIVQTGTGAEMGLYSRVIASLKERGGQQR